MRSKVWLAFSLVAILDDPTVGDALGGEKTNGPPLSIGNLAIVIAVPGEEYTLLRICRSADVLELKSHPGVADKARAMYLLGKKLTDSDVTQLPSLASIERIVVENRPFLTDESLSALARFSRLRDLCIEKTAKITGTGFRRFATDRTSKDAPPPPPLEELLLADNKMSDKALRYLARVRTLRKLVICEAGFTAKGLLNELPNARGLKQVLILIDEDHPILDKDQRRRLRAMMPNVVSMGAWQQRTGTRSDQGSKREANTKSKR
jgi:hypothetical protein